MRKRSAPASNLGIVSLVMTFLILCLVVFAVLSLSGAAGEYRYSQTLASHSRAYDEACNQALLKKNRIEESLLSLAQSVDARKSSMGIEEGAGGKAEVYESLIRESLADLDVEIQETEEGSIWIGYEIPMIEEQSLQVELEVVPFDQLESGMTRIRRFQLVSTREWKGDQSMNLF